MKRFILYLFILLVIGGGVYLFLNKTPGQQNEQGGSLFKSFFSRDSGVLQQPTDETTPIDEAVTVADVPENSPFKALSIFPVAGYTVFNKTTTSVVKGKAVITTSPEKTIRYISRKNGYIYETTDGVSALQITNIFIPNIYEGVFSKDAKQALVRFLRDDNKTIASYIIPVPETNPDGTRTQKQGIYLADNITSITTTPSKDSLFYTQKTPTGVSVRQTDFSLKNNREVFKSDFESWLPIKTNAGFYLQTKASGVAEGFLYQINDRVKNLKKIVGNIPGLTVSIDPKGEFALYSQTTNNGFFTRIYDIKNNTTISASLSVLPEKCVWLINQDLICAGTKIIPEGLYPDTWYAGTASFSDYFYKIYTKTGTYDVLTENPPLSFDVTYLSVDEANGTLFFIDKSTGILWSFDYR